MHNAELLVQSAKKTASTTTPKLLAVEFEVFGHHAEFVQNIADVWLASELDGCLEFLLTNRFKTVHASVVDHIRGMNDPRISLSFITESEETLLKSPSLKHWNGWKLFCDYATRTNANLGLLMYFDRFQLPIWLGKTSPIPFSGIYFRPTFHYHTFKGLRRTVVDRAVAWRKQFLLQRVLRNKKLAKLFSLDPVAVPYIQEHFQAEGRISHFADSFPRIPPSEIQVQKLRKELAIGPNRLVFCLIGVLDNRKGPMQLLESIRHLPPTVADKICILLAGRAPEIYRSKLESKVAQIQATTPVQLILRNEYIATSDVQSYFALADVMLTTYQYHKGSSSVLLRSASQHKPLLSSDYGLLGHLVRTYGLGITIDSSRPTAIAAGIVRMATSNPKSFLNVSNADRLARENSQEQLALGLSRLLEHATTRSACSLNQSREN